MLELGPVLGEGAFGKVLSLCHDGDNGDDGGDNGDDGDDGDGDGDKDEW